MAIYHVVLMKLKPTLPDRKDSLAEIDKLAKEGVRLIPGFIKSDIGEILLSSKQRAQGYDAAGIAVFESEEALEGYGPHEHHVKTLDKLKELVDGPPLIFDMEVA